MRCFPLILTALLSVPCWAAPGYAVWGTFKYAPGFDHFDYVNPQAPKGGELRLVAGSRISTFDKYNPFTLKGTAPSFLGDLLFESLLTGAMDEIGVGYGLLAEDVEVAGDRLSATFRLRPQARFHNGDPVLAVDVKHSYDTLVSRYAAPSYATLLADVAGCDVLDERTVRYRFKRPDRQLPLVVGGLPVFSAKWGVENGKAKPFDQVVTDVPIATGPYRIGPVRYGKDITYVRDAGYWGRNLAVRRGQDNFDRITVKIYRDNTAQLEALKAGEFDLMQFYSAGDWTRRLTGPRIDRGELVKQPFRHRTPDGFYSYVLNTRLRKVPGPPRAHGAGAGHGLRMDEPPAVSRQLQAGEGHFRQHRLRGQRGAIAAGGGAAGAVPVAIARGSLRDRWRCRRAPTATTPCAPTCVARRRC